VRSVLRALDRHFFAPERLSDLALMRIACVGATLLFFIPSLRHQLYLAQADPSLFRPIPALKVFMLPLGAWGARPDAMLLHGVWLGTRVAGVAGLLGLYTRPALFLFAAGNTLLTAHGYSYGEIHHPEALLVIALWLLAVSPSAAVLSLDALIDRVRSAVRSMHFEPRPTAPPESPFARWPLRTVQWLLVMVYLSAGLSKLVKGGLDWFNGYTLVYYFAEDGLRWGSPFGLGLARHPQIASVLSVGAVAFELTFVLAVLVRGLAPVYVLWGLVTHGFIYAAQRAPFFQYYALYVAFAESLRQAFRHWSPRVAPGPRAKATVIYDGRCPRQIRSMTILDALDSRRGLAYLDLEMDSAQLATLTPALAPDEAKGALHLATPDGRVHSGFFAFRKLARILPPLWLFLPLLHFPFATSIGPRAYALMACHRGRTRL
jgi:predicted DCC family thiol-disulfide oxidoreductase YuxK